MFTQNTAVFSNRSSRGTLPRRLLSFGLLASIATLCSAASNLESNSPFLPPGYNTAKPAPPKPVPQANGPLSRELEFRGVVQMGGSYQFSLFSKKDNRGYWIPENSSENGIRVSNFELDAMRITVNSNGRTEQLTLMNATDSPLPVARTAPTAAKQPKQPKIPGLNTSSKKPSSSSRVIPRRRVILPKK